MLLNFKYIMVLFIKKKKKLCIKFEHLKVFVLLKCSIYDTDNKAKVLMLIR